MKAFLWAIVACIGISVAAGYILTTQNGAENPIRTADNVRLH